MISALYLRTAPAEHALREGSRTIKVDEVLSPSELVPQILHYATKDVHREQLYACDFYRELDKRVPFKSEASDEELVWRMNVDHPIVYVLVAEMGQQPLHVVNDVYGDLVVYPDDAVQEAVHKMQVLCSELGYEVLNEPVKSEEEQLEEDEQGPEEDASE